MVHHGISILPHGRQKVSRIVTIRLQFCGEIFQVVSFPRYNVPRGCEVKRHNALTAGQISAGLLTDSFRGAANASIFCRICDTDECAGSGTEHYRHDAGHRRTG